VFGDFVAKVGGMKKAWLYLAVGVGILSSQALFDYVASEWAATHSNTISAISTVVGVLVTIYLINSFSEIRVAKQEEQRFRSIKKIAFRSLSQSVNDLGRRLIAPLTGIDLHESGVPKVTKEQVATYQRRIQKKGLSLLEVKSGFWGSISLETLDERLVALLEDPSFAEEMFRATSTSRRELQAALAEWAPVMVRVPQAYEDLAAGWPLADQIVRLAEAWRSARIAQSEGTKFDSSELRQSYAETISAYRSWLEDLQTNAELPTRGSHISDADWKFKSTSSSKR